MQVLKRLGFKGRILALIAALLIIEVFVYILFSHQLIEAVYQGHPILFGNRQIHLKTENPLSFYIKSANVFFVQVNLIIFSVVLSFLYILDGVKRWKNSPFLSVRDSFRSMKNYSLESHKSLLASLTLLLLFYSVYLTISGALLPNLERFNFFGADVWKPALDWTALEPSYHLHKGSHPLVPLIVRPGAILLYALTGSRDLAVLLLNAFFGALAVFFASIVFWILTRTLSTMVLLASLFGLSMSQLVFSVIPETYALASCSIVVTYLLCLVCLQTRSLFFGYWVLAGLFSFGVTFTNFAQTLICFTVCVFSLRQQSRIITILEYVGVVIFSAFLLSLLQKLVFRDSAFFFLPQTVIYNSDSLTPLILEQPLTVLAEIAKHFFLVNFVAPSPFAGIDPKHSLFILLTFFKQPINYSFLGNVGAIFWVGILGIGIIKNIGGIRCNPFLLAIGLNVLFCIALYSVFGVDEMFLYTCNFTFPVFLLTVNYALLEVKAVKVIVMLLLLVMGINNIALIRQMILT